MASYQGPTYAMFELDFGVRMVRPTKRSAPCCPMRAGPAAANSHHTLAERGARAYTYNDVPMELRRGLYRTDTHHYRNELN
jgi:GntR family transcriptional regulator